MHHFLILKVYVKLLRGNIYNLRFPIVYSRIKITHTNWNQFNASNINEHDIIIVKLMSCQIPLA